MARSDLIALASFRSQRGHRPVQLPSSNNSSTILLTGDARSEDANAKQSTPVGVVNSSSNSEPSHGRLLPLGRFLLVYACLSLAVLLTALDQAVVACILPNISAEFGARDAPWIGTAYLLTQTTFSPLYGRLSDVFGRKILFLGAQAIFLVGTLLCALAPTSIVLILGRAIAGIGGAGLFSMVHICISDVVTLRKRGTYHGILSAINGAGSAIGPLVGSTFASTGKSGWRLAFYFQLPIVGIAGICTAIFLPQIGNADIRKLPNKLKVLDYGGMFLFLSGSICFCLSLNFFVPPSVPFTSAKVLAPFLLSIALLTAFGFYESKIAKEPIVPMKIFRNMSVDLVFVLNFSFGYVFYGSLYYVPQFFQAVANESAFKSSLSLMPMVVMSILFSWTSGLATSILGAYKWSLTIAFTLQLLGAALLVVFFTPTVAQATSIGVLVVLGIGFGCQMQNTLVACQSATRQKEVAMATGVRNFFRNIGGVVSLSISGAILHGSLPRRLDKAVGSSISDDVLDHIQNDPLAIYTLPDELTTFVPAIVDVYADVFRIIFLVFVPLSALAFVVVIVLPEYSLDRAHDGEPQKRLHSSTNPVYLWRLCKGKLDKDRSKREGMAENA